jgi:hypothetical protein
MPGEYFAYLCGVYCAHCCCIHSFSRLVKGHAKHSGGPKAVPDQQHLYSHWLKDRWKLITVGNYKQFRADKKEWLLTRPRLFQETGAEIETVTFDGNSEVFPTLFDLKLVKNEFVGEDAEMLQENAQLDGILYDQSTTTLCYVYPLGFTGSLGNFQARGPMQCMKGHIETINRSLSGNALSAGAMQVYLLDSHEYRAAGSHHQESTKGLLAAFFGGAFRRNTLSEKKYKVIKKDLEINLPHERFNKTVADTHPMFRRQRIEVVWHVDVDQLTENDQNAEYVNSE